MCLRFVHASPLSAAPRPGACGPQARHALVRVDDEWALQAAACNVRAPQRV